MSPFRGLVLAVTTSAVGLGAVTPFLVIYGHRYAGLGGAAAGLLFVAQAVGELSGGLAGGLLADRLGARQVLVASSLGMAAFYAMLGVVRSPALAIITIFIAGLFEAAYHPTAFALVSDLRDEPDRPGAYGSLRAGSNAGMILGPLAGAALVSGVALPVVFVLAGTLLGVSGLVALIALPPGSRMDLAEEADEVRDLGPGLRAVLGDRALARLVIGGGLTAIVISWWEADGWAIVRTQRHFSTTTFSLMLALSAAVSVASQLPVSRLTRGRPAAQILFGGALIEALGLGLLTFADVGLGVVAVAVAVASIGQMIYGPHVSALVASLAPTGRAATYQAAISVTADIGNSAGPASGLAMSAGTGGQALWLIASPLAIIGGLIAAPAARQRKRGGSAAVDA
jgi:predicted MFS family arabinose efflux permease